MYDIVNKLIKKYETSNPKRLAKGMNIKLIYADLGENIRGFYQYFKRGRIICINNSLADIEQTCVTAHELGHAVLHKKMNRIFMDLNTLNVPGRYEREADLFSAYLIISDSDAKEYIDYNYTYGQISQMTGLKEQFVKQRIDDYIDTYLPVYR